MNSIAVHPSGRLALSVSRDSSLRLWNLVKGKSAHESTLSQPAERVAFSPDGSSYALVQGLQVCLWTKLSLSSLPRKTKLDLLGLLAIQSRYM